MSHSTPLDDLLFSLGTDRESGLTEQKAAELLQTVGRNKLSEKKPKTMLQRFFSQFKDVMIIILLVAAVISAGIAIYDFGEEGIKGFFEPLLIILIVVLNAVMGVVQESKAEKALDALKNLSSPNAKVIRDSKERIIPSEELVPGDIIHLEAGDFVPADARLIKSSSLKAEESALTGESVPSEKNAATAVDEKAGIGDRTNMVFSGCGISYGTGYAVVASTGMKTEMGKIAGLLENEDEGTTPLQQKLADLGKYLGIVALAACAIIFGIGLLDGLPIMKMFMTSVSLAVSAIPEGLPAIVTIVLSIGVQRMVKKNAIIRRLPAVETLGSASVICSDKTGTLTMNQMTLVKAYIDGGEFSDITENSSVDVKKLLTYGTLCSEGNIEIGENGKVTHIGDPTETSIILAAHQNGFTKADLSGKYPRLGSVPFDSDRKLMSVVVREGDKLLVVVKGAFDELAKRCIKGDLKKADEKNIEMSKNALRVLGVAYKYIDSEPADYTSELLEHELLFAGLVGMIDPPRAEAKDAVAVCRRAGIKPVMITGDHVVTASAIAKELDILREGDLAFTGAELDAMSDEELTNKVEDISVYARVSPENKIRIVKAWQKKDKVVSMTGDGVNDAPALKAADIGCAMGITGTDVAKGAADMTLTDDNFSTIVHAVKEGRGIYANIKKVVGYLLGTNVGEILVVFIAMIIARRNPLISMQLLWINLVTDSLPAIALGMEPVEKNIMDQPPKPKSEGIFANGFGAKIIFQGVFFALITLCAYFIGEVFAGVTVSDLFGKHAITEKQESWGQTMAFFVLALCQIMQSFNMRSERSLFSIGFFSNKSLNLSTLAAVGLMAFVLFVPGVNAAFGLSYLPANCYLIALGLAVSPLPVMELAKLIGRLIAKKPQIQQTNS
ncbi:MAG: cation-translocating P-type ATPase [Oscillospiraceae bacterium]|jgi:Ca2+-transporting ATPase|nr:cation-translocating P-type ATPase [Oscillospiraceae bacterium]